MNRVETPTQDDAPLYAVALRCEATDDGLGQPSSGSHTL
jgi:hypothetical protein